MKRYYITLGQNHVHRINGRTFDCDCVATFTSEDAEIARVYAFENFGSRFSFLKEEEPDMNYYPRGLIEI